MSGTTKIEETLPAPPVLNEAVSEQIRQYNRATRLAKLSSIVLEKVDFRVLPAALRADASTLKRELNVETELLEYASSSGNCIATISWTIVLRHKRKKVASCKASYVVFYYGLGGFSEEIIQMFIDHVGKTATYAYFRALYAQLDWSANLGSPPLPVVSFVMTSGSMQPPAKESAEKRHA